MALDQSALLEVLQALRVAEVDDRVRQAAQTIYQALIEAELTAVIGAAPGERTDTRTNLRNGHRPRTLSTTCGISKSEVSRICAELDSEVHAFAERSLAGQHFPYVFLDATYCKARVNRRVVAQAVVVATGVCGDGRREVLGFAVGDSEDGAFWTAFLRSLKARGLGGVQLVIADAHPGLVAAIGSALPGAAWQRCRTH